jgi:hypothetical protein
MAAAEQYDPLVDGAFEMFAGEQAEGLPTRQSPTSDFDPLVDGAAEMFGLEKVPEAGASRGPDPIYDESSEQAAFPQPAGETQVSEELAPTGRQPSFGQQALMGLINDNPDLQARFLEKKGFTTRLNPQTGEAEYEQSSGRWVPTQEGFVQYWPELVEGVLGTAATGARAIGAVGAPATGGASLAAAAGLGAGAGASLETVKQSLAKFLGLREEYDPTQIATKGAEMGFGAALGEGVTQVAGKTARGLRKAMVGDVSKARKIGQDTPEQVKAAAEKLGVGTTPGMLTTDKELRTIEATLDKMDFALGGQDIRKVANEVRVKIDDASRSILSKASLNSPAATGEVFKEKLMADIKKKLQPGEVLYNQIQDKLGTVKVNKTMQQGALEDLRKDIDIKSPEVRAALKDFEDRLGKVETVDRLKVLRTSLGKGIPQNPSDELRGFYNKAYDILTKMRADSFEQGVRDAKGNFLPSEYGQVLSKLKEADKIWKDTSKEVSDALLERGRKAKLGPEAEARKTVDKFALEKQGRFFRERDVEKTRALQKLSPGAAEELAEQKIAQILEKSTSTGEGKQGKINFQTLSREFRKISPEIAKDMFGKKGVEVFKAAEVLYRNVPFDPNPSKSGVNLGIQHFLKVFRHLNSLGLSGLRTIIQSDNPWATSAAAKIAKDLTKAGVIGTTGGSGLSKAIKESIEESETGKALKEGRKRATDKRNKR